MSINSDPAKVWKFFGNLKNKAARSNVTPVTNVIDQEAVDLAFDKIAPTNVIYRDNISERDLYDNQPHNRLHNEVLTNPIVLQEYISPQLF